MSLKMQLSAAVLIVCGSFISGVSAQKNEALNTFVGHKNLQYAGIGFKMVDTESGRVVCSYNENLALCPASTLKALTTATALELFGPDYRFHTQLAYNGSVDGRGVLKGDLIITGFGDPSLGSSHFSDQNETFLDEWFAAIQRKGIRSIEGDIVVADHLYGYEGVSSRWMWGDLGNYYASGTYGISIFDNSYELHLKSGAVNTTPTIVSINPEIPGLSFENHLKAAANTADSAYIYGIPFDFNRRIFGTIPALRTNFTIKGDIPDPGLLLAQTCIRHLQSRGIPVTGNATTSRKKKIDSPSRHQVILTHRGNTLQEIIRETNVRSNNHFAEHLFYKIGWDKEQACTSQHVPSLAADRIRQFWKNKGVDTEGLFLYDGNGLSNANGITANTLTSLLVYMQKQSKYADVFYLSLPLAGMEGTVRSFLKGTSLAGKARIKSGSISHVQAYTGYIEKGGKRYAFTLIVNNFTGSRATLRGQMERLLIMC